MPSVARSLFLYRFQSHASLTSNREGTMKLALSLILSILIITARNPALGETGGLPEPAPGISTTLIRILDASCTACFRSVRDHLATLEGFRGIRASLRARLVAVDTAPPLDGPAAAAAINALGYRTLILSGADRAGPDYAGGRPGIPEQASCCSTSPVDDAAPQAGPDSLSGSGTMPGLARIRACQGCGQGSGGCCASLGAWKRFFKTLLPRKLRAGAEGQSGGWSGGP